MVIDEFLVCDCTLIFNFTKKINQVYQRHKLVNSFKPAAFREEAALLSEGENMYAFQICNIPEKDEKILHYEFLGCIAEETDGEEGEEEERESNKRGKQTALATYARNYIFNFY